MREKYFNGDYLIYFTCAHRVNLICGIMTSKYVQSIKFAQVRARTRRTDLERRFQSSLQYFRPRFTPPQILAHVSPRFANPMF